MRRTGIGRILYHREILCIAQNFSMKVSDMLLVNLVQFLKLLMEAKHGQIWFLEQQMDYTPFIFQI